MYFMCLGTCISNNAFYPSIGTLDDVQMCHTSYIKYLYSCTFNSIRTHYLILITVSCDSLYHRLTVQILSTCVLYLGCTYPNAG